MYNDSPSALIMCERFLTGQHSDSAVSDSSRQTVLSETKPDNRVYLRDFFLRHCVSIVHTDM